MLELSRVTLCCIDTANHALAVRALRLSVGGVRFGRVLLLTDQELDLPDIQVRQIAPLASREAYSQFVLKELLPHIDTSHVLLLQWDGYVVNPAAWRDENLDCDYLGAKWFWYDDAMRVGNGGFSLRSRKLLEALQDPRIVLSGAEDLTIGRAFRPLLERDYGIRFGSEALADAFAFEAAYPIGKPFGFHGLFNFCRVVPPAELIELVRHFTPAIARSPQLLQLGRNCMAMGLWQPAAAVFRRILDEDADHAEAIAALARASANAEAPAAVGRNDPCPCGSGKRYKSCHGASDPARAAIASPASSPAPDVLLQRGLSLHQQGNLAQAEAAYTAVLDDAPEHPLAQHYLGVIRYQQKDLEQALPLLERSVAQVPSEPEFRNNLGLALAAADRDEDAVAAYRAALALKPDHAVAWNNLGLALQARNDVSGAIEAFRRAIALKPDFAHAHWNLSLALLVDSQFDEGWREYEWRLALPELGRNPPRFAGLAWDGSAPAGKTLLVYAEQGLGDALQFARYASRLAQAGACVVIHAPEALKRLLATVPGVAAVCAPDEALPAYDAHCPLLSLPRLVRTTAETIPAAVPYLTASKKRREAVRAAIAAHAGALKVGVCWAGGKIYANDRKRSIALSALAPLFELRDVAWFSLQKGEPEPESTAAGAEAKLICLDARNDLDGTAAMIAELDLVLSVDTSIAHLAGALARPAWVMLPFAPDWRWQLGRDDSPWYPTLRLFRQPRPNDWAAVVGNVSAQLISALPTKRAAER
jgi:tetratricopeptide (TPR) repeat protein